MRDDFLEVEQNSQTFLLYVKKNLYKMSQLIKCNEDCYNWNVMTSRFTVAIHILSLLALNKGESRTSDELAISVNTNPVVIRKILGILRKAGFIQIQMGQGGGASLALDSEKITLKDIYLVFDERLFALHPSKPNGKCICGKNIQPILMEVFSETERILVNELSNKTIQQISSEILKRSK